ncbi:MAG: polysaccharide deacetylase family protein [Thermodesulfobacteriota bacterium]|nr:polysaccharide deacetylase family protein [Thermodesulfobacteriota bacterium]
MRIGLRIDSDTFRGTKYDVPNLCLLSKYSITASFFFSVGPDNMGRHVLRLIRPLFLWKMLRTKASTLYGWDIFLRGILWPGPVIGEKLIGVIRSVSDAGHEIGLHAWDHHAWQTHIDTMNNSTIYGSLNQGVKLLMRILGRPPECSAAPGWKCNNLTLLEKTRFPFNYNSDCRSESIFYPLVHGKKLSQPQIPVTLPTYDEVIGSNRIRYNNYNDYIFSLIKPEKLNVMTIHAEVEGIARLAMFDRFLEMMQSTGESFIPLGTLLQESPYIGQAAVVAKKIPGRNGWVSCQSQSVCPSIGESTEV